MGRGVTDAPAATTDDLLRAGWCRTFTGFWLDASGYRILSEADALAEVAQSIAATTPPREPTG